MTEFLKPLLDLLNEMTPYLLLGFFIAGILHEFVPSRIYYEKLSRNNFSSILWATLFGIPLPLCSCGVIPTGTSLYREGASKGATVSFLISTPQTGVDSILATASLIGIPFAIMRPLVAFVTAITGGLLVNRFDKEEKSSTQSMAGQTAGKSFLAKVAGAFKYGFVDMIQDIGKWIIIGLGVAALITVLLPDNFFVEFNDYPLLNMFLILAVSMPMYLCATGSIPIAVALMLKGLSPGAALVLLMAGPATNMATILVINKVLGRKTLIIYLMTIILGSMGFGLLIDHVLPAEWFAVSALKHDAACCGATVPWWQTVSSIIFIALLVTAFILKHRKKDCHCESCTAKKKYRIEGMMCNHCKNNVEKRLSLVEGVKGVHVDLAEGAAYVEGENIDKEKIISAIKELGYKYIDE